MFYKRTFKQHCTAIFKMLNNDWHLFVLAFKNYAKQFDGPFFSLIFPALTFLIFAATYGQKGHINKLEIMAGYTAMAFIGSGFQALAFKIIEWKNSILIKRIESTTITRNQFLAVMITLYTLISVVSGCWTMMWGVIAFPGLRSGVGSLAQSNAGYLILGFILISLLSSTLGIFLAGLAKGIGTGNALVTMVFFPTIFLSGIFIPTVLFPNWLRIISYFIPYRGAVGLLNYGYANVNNFDVTGFHHLWTMAVVTLAWAGVFITLTKFTFRWE